jgi:hypothetical protein
MGPSGSAQQPTAGELVMRCRLIGGPFDGYWAYIPKDRQVFRKVEQLPMEFFDILTCPQQIAATALAHDYVEQWWFNPDRSRVRVFIWSRLDVTKALEHILNNWNPNSRGGQVARSVPDPISLG